MARKKIDSELKRKPRPVSLSDPEYKKLMDHIQEAYIGMNFSQVVRYLFEKDMQDYKVTQTRRMGVIRKDA